MSDKITTVLSDGMEQMKDNMAESVIIAGMGGDLIVDILSRGSRIKGIKELVLSPHKRIDLVRKFLSQNCWEIIKEDMVMDGGKYYTIIKAVKGQNTEYTDVELLYGKYLLETKNQVLKQYLKKENEKFSKILNTMKESGNVNDFQIKEVLKMNQKGRAYYD